MILAAKILMGCITLGFILWPYVRNQEVEAVVTPQGIILRDLLEQKEHIYAAIKELDFDYKMDKLSEEDYQQLNKEYKQKAVDILQEIDKLSDNSESKASA